MISDDKFDAGLRLLQSHYNKHLSDGAISIWREYLDNELDDEEFTAAVKQCIITCEFFPTAKKLVELVANSLQVKAMEEWRTVLKWAAFSEENQKKILPSLSPRCRTALQIIGGFRTVGYAEEWELNKIEKHFITAYCECSPNTKALPPAQIPHVNFEAVEEEAEISFDISNKPDSMKIVLEALEMRMRGEKLSEQQQALNMFVLKWKWQIDEGRLNHYLALSQNEKVVFLSRFGYAMRHKPGWKSAVTYFDSLANYQPPSSQVDFRAIAREWLQEEMN